MATSAISNTLTDPSGTALADVVVVARLKPGNSFRTSDNSEVSTIKSTTTNGSGAWSLTLEENANIVPSGTYYEIEEQIPVSAGGAQVWRIEVGASDATLRASLLSTLPTDAISGNITQDTADARYVATGSDGVGWVDVKRDHGAEGDGTTDDTSSIQAALTAARTAGGGTVFVPKGTYLVSLQDHPETVGYRSALVIGSKTHLRLDSGAIIKMAASQTSGHTNNSMLINYSLTASGDNNIIVEGGTFDGNCVNQTVVISGVLFFRTRTAKCINVTSKNHRGTATSGSSEKFQFSTTLSEDTRYINCTALMDDAGSTSSGFSANSATGVHYIGCVARNMSVTNGFTHNTCRQVLHTNCRSYSNAFHGFNSEVSDDVVYVACIAGSDSSSAAGNPFSSSTALGNTQHGFSINGSTRADLVACISRRNGQGVNFASPGQGRVIGGDFSDNTAYGFGTYDSSKVRITGGPYASGNPTALAGIPGVDLTTALGYVGAANPAVPATTVAQTNPFPFDAFVSVSGGTVTDIALGGQATGLTSGTFRVPVAGTITLTYSSVPTWRWYID